MFSRISIALLLLLSFTAPSMAQNGGRGGIRQIVKELGLSPEQKKKMREVILTYRYDRFMPESEMKARLVAILTDEQRIEFRRILQAKHRRNN